MEAARVPQQLLGELFVKKGLITAEELAEALEEQKESGKRIGHILVKKGFVSGPALTTVLAEQLGVEMEKQEGFGSGLWSEIKRRHPRVKGREDTEEPLEPVAPSTPHDRRLALIDDLDDSAPEEQVDWMGLNDSDAELENLRQQLRFASTRLEEERAGHKGTLRLLEESRKERDRLTQEVDDWQERAGRAGDSDEMEQAVARLAELEATVAEQRAELETRDGELAAGTEVQTELGAEAGRLEKELQALRDEHAGSKAAIAALTAQVDELRAGTVDSQRLLDEARVEATGLEVMIAELREELSSRANTGELEQALSVVREEMARLEQISEKRKAKVKELQGLLEDERATSIGEADSRAALEKELQALRDEHGGSKAAIAALTAQVDEQRASGEALDRMLTAARVEAAASQATVGELREELASRGDTGELEHELSVVREDMARLEQVSEQRKAKVKELAQALRNAQDSAAGLEQLVSEREQALAREIESRAGVEAEALELRRQAPKASELERELAAVRAEMARQERVSEQRKAKVKELQTLLDDERGRSAAAADLEQQLTAATEKAGGLEQQVSELEQALAHETESRAALDAEAAKLRREVPRVSELERVLAALREDATRLEQVSEKRKVKVKELAQELRNAQDSAAGLEQRVSEREQARAREAEARAAVELQLASLGASADALDQRLQEECAAHVATRRELGRLEADLAELQPLTDKLAATETELVSCARLLEEVSAGLDSAKERIGERTYDPDRHVMFVPVEGVYRLADMSGPTPEVGAYEDIDGVRFLVTRIGPSPLPADTRRCAFLEVC